MLSSSNNSGLRDNHTRGTVADFLRGKSQTGSKLSIVSAYFTIYAYDALKEELERIEHLAVTFRKRAASGLQSGRGFILPNAHEQVHEKTDLELVTWLVIKEDNA